MTITCGNRVFKNPTIVAGTSMIIYNSLDALAVLTVLIKKHMHYYHKLVF